MRKKTRKPFTSVGLAFIGKLLENPEARSVIVRALEKSQDETYTTINEILRDKYITLQAAEKLRSAVRLSTGMMIRHIELFEKEKKNYDA